ncbi:hypothetical protein ACSQ67_007982 [Phaseolus vulgaris]
MVLWEITLAAAYVLGLKRTYRLALRTQRRILAPKIRQFLHRRTRAVFNVALKVNQTIQERDMTFGGSLSNSAPHPSSRLTKLAAKFSNSKTSSYYQLFKRKSGKQNTWFQQKVIWSKPFPSIVKMMRPPSLAGTTTQCRHLNSNASDAFSPNYRVNWPGDVIRKDIMQWMLRN